MSGIDPNPASAVELVIEGRGRDIGAFEVRRVLPTARRRAVGPFVFFDHMGPADLPPGVPMSVRPHPHIGLATITWLFDGEIWHRDSLANSLPIRPGEVNWMIAGRGIVHSERSGEVFQRTGGRVEGIQAWMALPVQDEEMDPAFEHHDADALPAHCPEPGVSCRVIAGTAFGLRSPVGVRSPTLYVEARLRAGASFTIDTEHEERAIYLVSGRVAVDGALREPATMLVLRPGVDCRVVALDDALLMVLGGAALPEPRFIWWNLVSSRPERIEQAAADWRARRFPLVPGDEQERTEAPDDGPGHAARG